MFITTIVERREDAGAGMRRELCRPDAVGGFFLSEGNTKVILADHAETASRLEGLGGIEVISVDDLP